MLQPPHDLARHQSLDPRGGELDGQRDSVEPAADLRDVASDEGCEREARLRRAGATNEESNRRVGHEQVGVVAAVVGRDGQRWHVLHALAGEPEGLATRRQHAYLGAVLEQPHGRGPAGAEQVLAIVQEEQQPAAADGGDDGVEQRLARELLNGQRARQRCRQQRRVRQRRQLDQHSIIVSVGDGERELGLADPGRPSERNQPVKLQRARRAGRLPLAAEEAPRADTISAQVRRARPGSRPSERSLNRGRHLRRCPPSHSRTSAYRAPATPISAPGS